MSDKTSQTPTLAGFQKKHLRGLAHGLKPTVIVGAAGVTKAVLKEVDAALESHELIKVKLMEPEDKKAMAAELAEGTASVTCGLVGHVVILYRAHPEKPTVELPQRHERKETWRKEAMRRRP